MFALSSKNVSSSVCRTSRPVPGGVSRVCMPVRRQPRVIARSSEYSTGDDVQAQLQTSWEKTSKFIKDTWEDTANAEKPAIVAIVVAVIIAQLSIGATLDVVERLPLAKPFFEFVGLAVAAVYGYRYFTKPGERESWKKVIDNFVSAVSGQ